MSNQEERWRQIQEFEGLYSVSDKGRVWSYKSNKILIPGKPTNNYLYVILCQNGKKFTKRIHRLVAKAFIPNPEGLKEINHIDEDKTNNVVSNLEWCSAQFNIEYSKSCSYVLYDLHDNQISIFNLNKFARDNNLDVSHLHQVATGKINSYAGYTRQPGTKFKRTGPFSLLSPTGEGVTFETQQKAAEYIKTYRENISKLLLGKQKSCKGWTLSDEQ